MMGSGQYAGMFQSRIKRPVTSGAQMESTAAGCDPHSVPHVAGSLVGRSSEKERGPWHKTVCCYILTQAQARQPPTNI